MDNLAEKNRPTVRGEDAIFKSKIVHILSNLA